MNELFASEPSLCQTEEEFNRLVGQFGPFSGRYLAAYPNDWAPLSEAALSQLKDIARQRITQKLRRAREELRLLPQPALRWERGSSWMANVSPYLQGNPPVLDGLICHARSAATDERQLALSELDLPPTAEERMPATPSEYVRVSRFMLHHAPEIHFIDPYLDLNNTSIRSVMTALLQCAARGRCRRIVLWANHRRVIGDRKASVIEADLRDRAAAIRSASGLRPDIGFTYNLIDDRDSVDKMHARYLLTFRGGVRFDQGFKALGPNHKMDVGPIGKRAFEEIYAVYFLGRNDMKVAAALSI